MEVSGHLHAPAALCPVPTAREGGGRGFRARLDDMEKRKIFMPPSGMEPGLLGHPTRSLFAIPTGTSRFHNFITEYHRFKLA
jgi:hypothetical protein